MVEVKSPVKGSSHASHVKSPMTAGERTKRRQSLTGIQESRRSSLGGGKQACKLMLLC